jgi:hypothetical protein
MAGARSKAVGATGTAKINWMLGKNIRISYINKKLMR